MSVLKAIVIAARHLCRISLSPKHLCLGHSVMVAHCEVGQVIYDRKDVVEQVGGIAAASPLLPI